MPCTVCHHPQRQAIDQALLNRGATLEALAKQYNLSTSALHRHKAHLQAKVSRAKDRLQDNLRQGCLFWLSQALEMTRQAAKAAQAEGNLKLVLQAIQQGTRLLTIMLKQDIHLDDRLVYQILASPQWTAQDSLLPDDPNIMAMSRQSLAGALSSHCPETAAANPAAVSQEDLDLLQQLLPALTLPEKSGPGFLSVNSSPALKHQNQKVQTGIRHFNHREKSEKLPGKTPFDGKNIKEKQEDSLREKNTGKDAPSCQAGAWLEEIAVGRLDFDYLNAIGAGRNLPDPLGV
jgi:transposase-like protein